MPDIKGNVFQQDFSLAKPASANQTEEERGYNKCCDPFKVLADLTDNARYKNDVNSAWAFGDTVVFTLKKDGVTTTYVPTNHIFPNQPDAQYCTIEWRQVLSSDGPGCYTIEVVSTIAGIIQPSFTFGTYNLLPYQINDYFVAKGTARILSQFNDVNSDIGINFTDSLMLDSLRISGKFGYFQPNTEVDNIEYVDGQMQKIKREDFDNYELRTNQIGFTETNKLRQHLLAENNCWMSDHNYDSFSYFYFDVPVIVQEGFVPDHVDGTRLLTGIAKFEDKVKKSRSSYSGNRVLTEALAPPVAPDAELPPVVIPDIYGYDFDGIDEYLDLGDNINPDLTDTFSFSLWVKTTGSNQYIFSKSDGSVGYELFMTGAGRVDFHVRGLNGNFLGTAASISTTNNGDWHHIAITNDGSGLQAGLKLYIDAVDVSLTEGNQVVDTMITNTSLLIGQRNGSSFYEGRQDDFRYYDTELTPANITTLFNNTFIGGNLGVETNRWKYGEEDTYSGGWTINDSIGSVTGVSVNMEEEDRKMGVAYSGLFNGTNESVDFGAILDKDSSDAFTIIGWVKRIGTNGTILSKKDNLSPFRGYALNVSSSKLGFLLTSTSGTSEISITSTNNLNTDWNHVAITVDGSSLASGCKLYINGVLETNVVITDNLTTTTLNSADLSIGSVNNTADYLNAYKMYLSVYSTELSASEITDSFNSNVPIPPVNISLTSDLDVRLFGPNDNGTTITDESGNGNNGTLINMDLTNKESETP